jgi:PAS domain S-box-containing protein
MGAHVPDKEKLSQTMRIDLIPDTPAEPQVGKKRRLVITSPNRMRRAKARTAELNSDSRYHELLQSIYDAALICDLEGNIVDANARAIEFLLYGRTELVDMTVFNVISGADESLIHTLCDNLEDERYTLIQAYCRRKNATLFPAEIAVNKLNLGEMHLCFFLRDITWRRQAEAMLRTEHNAIQNAYNGIAVADIEAKLEYVNPAVARMWGYDGPADLLETDVRDLLCDVDKASEMIGSVMGDGADWTGEMLATGRDGQEFDVAVSAVCNRNSDGDIVGMIFSMADVSDRKAAEVAQRENEQHRVMLESLGAACHHLGQPATVLLANLGIIQKKLASGDDVVPKLVDSSIEAVKTLGQILRKLNAVNEYKTTYYLGDENDESAQSRILEI